MKSSRSIIAMLVFLAIGVGVDYVINVVLGSADTVLYLWLVAFFEILFGASFLGFLYINLHLEWVTKGSAITCIVVGGLILLFTPLWITFAIQFQPMMESLYSRYPNFTLPAIPAGSMFAISALLLVVTGVYHLVMPKMKKRR
jgi:hypothetical protein